MSGLLPIPHVLDILARSRRSLKKLKQTKTNGLEIIDNQEYDLTDLSDQGSQFIIFVLTNERLQELGNMQASLQRAKNSYISESFKKETILQKRDITDEQNRTKNAKNYS